MAAFLAGLACMVLLAFAGLARAENSLPYCLFLHGIDVHPAPSGHKYYSTFDSYWGIDMPRRVAGSCTPVFLRTDTLSRGWNDMNLISEFCTAIKDFDPAVVFTHSMGNLLVAAGIHMQIPGCFDKILRTDLSDHSKAIWYGIQGPWNGSATALHCAKEICPKPSSLLKLPNDAFRDVCQCSGTSVGGAIATFHQDFVIPGKQNIPALAFDCSVQNAQTKAKCVAVSDYHKKYLFGNLCGLTPHSFRTLLLDEGLLLPVVAKLVGKNWGPDNVINYKARTGNDGVIGYKSCTVDDGQTYASTATDPFYALKGNHLDGTGREGDVKKDKKQPGVWYRAMAAAGVAKYKKLNENIPPPSSVHVYAETAADRSLVDELEHKVGKGVHDIRKLITKKSGRQKS